MDSNPFTATILTTTGGADAPLAHTLGPLLKPSEVARNFGVSRTWVYDAAKDGKLPSVRLGGPDGPLRFVAEDLIAWLDERRRTWTPSRAT